MTPQHDTYDTSSDDTGEDLTDPVEIPFESIKPELLNAIVESFVLREGTDYGEQELSLAAKVARLRRQFERGEVKLIYDPSSASVTFVDKHTRILAN